MGKLPKPLQILFGCTGNSARSIFGECLIRRFGRGLREAYHLDAGDGG
jgi:arsenate reductase (thioredoxin)